MKKTTESVTEGLDLTGRRAVVTGASSGIGQEIARVLALRGARVTLAVRNVEKGHRVVESFGDSAGRCDVGRCDLASMASVRAFAHALEGPIHLVHLNAGVFGIPFTLTDEGFEYTYAANYVGHFLLVHELAASRKLAPDARIVATMSEGGYLNPFARLELDLVANAPASERKFSKMSASPNAKLLLALLAGEWGRRVTGTPLAGTTFNAVNPGATLTDNVNQLGPVMRVLGNAFSSILFKPVEVGAASLLWAATDPALATTTGAVFNTSFRRAKLPARCTDPEAARLAWDATEKALGLSAFA